MEYLQIGNLIFLVLAVAALMKSERKITISGWSVVAATNFLAVLVNLII